MPQAGVRIVSVFGRKWYFDSIRIDNPVAQVFVDKNGVSNIPDPQEQQSTATRSSSISAFATPFSPTAPSSTTTSQAPSPPTSTISQFNCHLRRLPRRILRHAQLLQWPTQLRRQPGATAHAQRPIRRRSQHRPPLIRENRRCGNTKRHSHRNRQQLQQPFRSGTIQRHSRRPELRRDPPQSIHPRRPRRRLRDRAISIQPQSPAAAIARRQWRSA